MAYEIIVFGHSLVRRLRDFTVQDKQYNLNLDKDVYSIFWVTRGGLHLENLDDEVETVKDLKPDALILDLGANDLDGKDADPQFVAKQVINLAVYLADLTKHGVVFVVQAYHRLKPRTENYETTLPVFNAYLKEGCEQATCEHYRIIYWPHRNLTQNWEQFMLPDGIHFNVTGLQRYRRSIRGAVLKAKQQVDVIRQ